MSEEGKQVMSDESSSGDEARKTRTGNILVGFALTALFSVFLYLSLTTLTYHAEFGPGPGFIPTWVSAGAVGCSVWVLVRSVIGSYDFSGSADFSGAKRSFAYFGAIVLVSALVPILGLILALAVFLLISLIVVERRPVRPSVGVAVGAAVICYLLLARVLHVPMPQGFILESITDFWVS